MMMIIEVDFPLWTPRRKWALRLNTTPDASANISTLQCHVDCDVDLVCSYYYAVCSTAAFDVQQLESLRLDSASLPSWVELGSSLLSEIWGLCWLTFRQGFSSSNSNQVSMFQNDFSSLQDCNAARIVMLTKNQQEFVSRRQHLSGYTCISFWGLLSLLELRLRSSFSVKLTFCSPCLGNTSHVSRQ